MSSNRRRNKKSITKSNQNAPTSGIVRQCQYCFVFEKSPSLILQSCSGCVSSHYCSSICQKADWPEHKTICNLKMEWKARVKEMGRWDPGQSGTSNHAMYERFKKWRQTHRLIIHWATAQALTLEKTPKRLPTHGLFIVVKPNPHTVNSTPPGLSFDIESVTVETIDEIRQFIPQTEVSQKALNDLVGPRSKELRKVGGLGFAIAVMILLVPEESTEPLMPILLPMGFPDKLSHPSDPNWREGLYMAVKAGGLESLVDGRSDSQYNSLYIGLIIIFFISVVLYFTR